MLSIFVLGVLCLTPLAALVAVVTHAEKVAEFQRLGQERIENYLWHTARYSVPAALVCGLFFISMSRDMIGNTIAYVSGIIIVGSLAHAFMLSTTRLYHIEATWRRYTLLADSDRQLHALDVRSD